MPGDPSVPLFPSVPEAPLSPYMPNNCIKIKIVFVCIKTEKNEGENQTLSPTGPCGPGMPLTPFIPLMRKRWILIL